MKVLQTIVASIVVERHRKFRTGTARVCLQGLATDFAVGRRKAGTRCITARGVHCLRPKKITLRMQWKRQEELPRVVPASHLD